MLADADSGNYKTTVFLRILTGRQADDLVTINRRDTGFVKLQILAVSDDALLEKIKAYKDELKAGVMKKKDKIENVGYKKYMEEM